MTIQELKEKFPLGCRVKVFDHDEGQVVFGTVLGAKEPLLLTVQWDDLSTPCDHDKSEINEIEKA